MRSFLAVLPAVVAFEDEYHVTSLLQTKLERASAFTSNMKFEEATSRAAALFRSSKGEEDEVKAVCEIFYGEDGVEKCMGCYGELAQDAELHKEIEEAFAKGPDAGIQLIFDVMDECTELPNLLVKSCGDAIGPFACLSCTIMAECRKDECKPEAAKEFGDCVGWMQGDAKESLIAKHRQPPGGRGPPPPPPCDPGMFKEACEMMYPEVEGEKCAAAGCKAFAVLFDPSTMQKCPAAQGFGVDEECVEALFLDTWDEECGDENIVKKECGKAVGGRCEVNEKQCFEAGMKCKDCDDFPPSDACKKCVGETYPCDDLILMDTSKEFDVLTNLKKNKMQGVFADLILKASKGKK